ncbi:MAG: hypothetical protein Q7U47_03565 [Paludibacter sp.]|nr:hypothetical protein [Paludibacter sp.]
MSKKENKYPSLLVISINAWSDSNSVGNTISNQFGGWDKSKLSNLYLRNEEIDNDRCSVYFRICDKDVIKSLFTGKDLGVELQYKENKTQSKKPVNRKQSFFNLLVQIRPTFILILRELLWCFGFNKKDKLNDFLKKQNPEIIHIHCPHLIYGHRVLHYCKKVTNAKIVVFFGDELHGYKNFWPLYSIYQLILRHWIKKTIKISDVNYAVTKELCNYYSGIFGREFKLLYKGAIILPPIQKSHVKPYKMVYAGNLLYDRWRVLALISKAIESVSEEQDLFELHIYSATPLTKEMNQKLNTKNSTVKGAIPFNEVKRKLSDADIVLHVEAFNKSSIRLTKYSFSTKIVDIIESGSCVMGVGPSELASINFLKQSGSAIVANSFEDICTQLRKIINEEGLIYQNQLNMYNYAKNIFDLNFVRNKLYNDISEILHK